MDRSGWVWSVQQESVSSKLVKCAFLSSRGNALFFFFFISTATLTVIWGNLQIWDVSKVGRLRLQMVQMLAIDSTWWTGWDDFEWLHELHIAAVEGQLCICMRVLRRTKRIAVVVVVVVEWTLSAELIIIQEVANCQNVAYVSPLLNGTHETMPRRRITGTTSQKLFRCTCGGDVHKYI